MDCKSSKNNSDYVFVNSSTPTFLWWILFVLWTKHSHELLWWVAPGGLNLNKTPLADLLAEVVSVSFLSCEAGSFSAPTMLESAEQFTYGLPCRDETVDSRYGWIRVKCTFVPVDLISYTRKKSPPSHSGSYLGTVQEIEVVNSGVLERPFPNT